jgi:hypothetical protein
LVGLAIALVGGAVCVAAGTGYGRRIRRAAPFERAPRGGVEQGDIPLARAVLALEAWGSDSEVLAEAVRGCGSFRAAVAEVNTALNEVNFILSSGRAAAALGIRMALTAGLLGAILEVLGGVWSLGLGAAISGGVGAGVGWELLRRGDATAGGIRLEWDRVAALLESRLRAAPAPQNGPGDPR